MEHRSALTLKPGDLLDIPGIGTRVVGAINEARPGRYMVRLEAKFEPAITIDVVISPLNREPAKAVSTQAEQRLNSRDPSRIREDLSASLWLALSTRDQSRGLRMSAEAIVDSIVDHRDGQDALRKVAEVFGPVVYGTVLRFHIEAGTSLGILADALSRRSQLAKLGLTVGDLGWPGEALDDAFTEDDAPTNPTLEASLADAVSCWKRSHAEPATDTAGDSSLT